MKYTKEFKASVVERDIDKAVGRAKYADFRSRGYFPDEAYFRVFEEYGKDSCLCAMQLNRNTACRRRRVTEKIGSLIRQGKVIFLTLTFTDEVLSRTSVDTRRQYVRKYLKKHCSAYVANIDFGKKNEREHYHALVVSEGLDYRQWHKYGAIKGERVHDSEKDEKKTVKYLVKLSRHALKDLKGTCPRIIYSRDCSALK